jgi:hypothetical protein
MLSTFNFRAYLSIFLMMVILTALFIIGLQILIEGSIAAILTFSIFSISLILLIVYEFRNKIISIIVAKNHLRKSSYFAEDRIYDFKEIDGFLVMSSKGILRNSEYLYLIQDGARIVTLSQVYHKNYHELKAIISERSKNLGEANYDVFDEIIEIITLNF